MTKLHCQEDLNGEAIRLSQLNARVKNIEVVYNEVVLVIKGLSLKVEKGEIVSLLGANGAGKSTTLKAVSSLLKNEDGEVTRGNIYFLGKEITNSNPSEIVKKGLFQVMEGRRCIADMTVDENLRLGAHTRSDRKNISRDIEKVLNYFLDLGKKGFIWIFVWRRTTNACHR